MVDNLIVGSGNFKFKVIQNWEKLPAGFSWRETAAVIADIEDNIYVFNRGNHPVIIFDRFGNYKSSWGENVFTRPHGLTLGPDETIFCADDGDHTIRKCTLDGRILMTLGNVGKASLYQSGNPFHRPTDIAFDPITDDIYVSDGYGNSKVHKYSADGRLLFSWGQPGTDPGQFNIVHNIATDKDGYVYVADRENHRVQIFDRNGKYETQWNNLHRPCALYISKDQLVYVGELGSGLSVNRNMPNIGPRITILNTKGVKLTTLGSSGWGLNPGQFIAPHGIAVDSQENLYLSEVSWTNLKSLGCEQNNVRSFQKLERIPTQIV